MLAGYKALVVGIAKALDISCHSLIRVARLVATLMTDGAALPAHRITAAPSMSTAATTFVV